MIFNPRTQKLLIRLKGVLLCNIKPLIIRSEVKSVAVLLETCG